jgi:hypothetical protein
VSQQRNINFDGIAKESSGERRPPISVTSSIVHSLRDEKKERRKKPEM